jgi:uncharacterized protein YoaH (UPF0181 family)
MNINAIDGVKPVFDEDGKIDRIATTSNFMEKLEAVIPDLEHRMQTELEAKAKTERDTQKVKNKIQELMSGGVSYTPTMILILLARDLMDMPADDLLEVFEDARSQSDLERDYSNSNIRRLPWATADKKKYWLPYEYALKKA